MLILHSIADLASLPGPLVLAAGTFDGVHLGHQALICRALKEAALLGGTAVVMTFDRHPASLLRPNKAPKLLTSKERKLALLEQLGVSVLLLLEFNEALSTLPPEAFIRSLAASAKRLHLICVGSQWSFGRGGAGNIPLLEKLGGELGFTVREIAPVKIGGEPISSTRIRNAITSGNFDEAKICLGRTFLLYARVVTGAGLGARIGFPTANLAVAEMQIPPDGVYAVKVDEGKRKFSGVANIGVRPTLDLSDAKRTVEVHLFDLSENLVGKELCIEFLQFLRGELKFSDFAALATQIAKDCQKAQDIFTESFVSIARGDKEYHLRNIG